MVMPTRLRHQQRIQQLAPPRTPANHRGSVASSLIYPNPRFSPLSNVSRRGVGSGHGSCGVGWPSIAVMVARAFCASSHPHVQRYRLDSNLPHGLCRCRTTASNASRAVWSAAARVSREFSASSTLVIQSCRSLSNRAISSRSNSADLASACSAQAVAVARSVRSLSRSLTRSTTDCLNSAIAMLNATTSLSRTLIYPLPPSAIACLIG